MKIPLKELMELDAHGKSREEIENSKAILTDIVVQNVAEIIETMGNCQIEEAECLRIQSQLLIKEKEGKTSVGVQQNM